MIVASDLDRTLMYSNRALEELGIPEGVELKAVEMTEGKWAGYMTKSAFSLLQKLNSRCLFIPVTTRTTDQFKRFVIFEKEIPLTYAITSNGANILYQGEILKDWQEKITARMKAESSSKQDLLSALVRGGFRLDGHWKEAEKLFFYFILNTLPTASELEEIRKLTSKYGWRNSLQGRKLYFIPEAISKGKALQYICERTGVEAAAGAGDSILDWDFLQHCQFRCVPSHGELNKYKVTGDFTKTNTYGITAGEEILRNFLSNFSLKI